MKESKQKRKGECSMKPEKLASRIDEMFTQTKKGAIEWFVNMQTTELMDDSLKDQVEDEEGHIWLINECYTEFTCKYAGEPFHLITYELIKTCGDKTQTNNLLFLAPDGMRRFDLDLLAPYNIENSAVLSYKIHELWLFLLNAAHEKKPNIHLDAFEPPVSDMPNAPAQS